MVFVVVWVCLWDDVCVCVCVWVDAEEEACFGRSPARFENSLTLA